MPDLTEPEVIAELKDGWTLRSSHPLLMAGDYVRLCRPDGSEYLYWQHDEWRDDPITVVGAIINAAAGFRPADAERPTPQQQAEAGFALMAARLAARIHDADLKGDVAAVAALHRTADEVGVKDEVLAELEALEARRCACNYPIGRYESAATRCGACTDLYGDPGTGDPPTHEPAAAHASIRERLEDAARAFAHAHALALDPTAPDALDALHEALAQRAEAGVEAFDALVEAWRAAALAAVSDTERAGVHEAMAAIAELEGGDYAASLINDAYEALGLDVDRKLDDLLDDWEDARAGRTAPASA